MPDSPFPDRAGPGLVISPASHWCAKHLEPYRQAWGKNVDWILATMGLLEECFRHPEIMQAAGRDPAMLNRVLLEYAPLCCYLGDETTDRWVQLSRGPLDDYTHALEAIRARKAE